MKHEPKFLKAVDTVTLGIDGLGEQKQKVARPRSKRREWRATLTQSSPAGLTRGSGSSLCLIGKHRR
jgi:hypothetical protein